MKRCPKCGQTYSDPGLNFCLNDGELLMQELPERPGNYYADDPPPTVFMGESRQTDPTAWTAGSPPAVWQGQQIITPPGHSPLQYANFASPNVTLGIISMVLGISSVTVGWCCYTGMLLGPAAMITGFIALMQHKSDPTRYGGKAFGIAGIVMGALYVVLILLFILLYGAATIGNILVS